MKRCDPDEWVVTRRIAEGLPVGTPLIWQDSHDIGNRRVYWLHELKASSLSVYCRKDEEGELISSSTGHAPYRNFRVKKMLDTGQRIIKE